MSRVTHTFQGENAPSIEPPKRESWANFRAIGSIEIKRLTAKHFPHSILTNALKKSQKALM